MISLSFADSVVDLVEKNYDTFNGTGALVFDQWFLWLRS